MRADISSIIQIQSRRIKGKQLTIGRRGIKRTCNCVRCPTVSSMPWCKGKYITSGCGALCPLSRLKSKRQKKKKEKKKRKTRWNGTSLCRNPICIVKRAHTTLALLFSIRPFLLLLLLCTQFDLALLPLGQTKRYTFISIGEKNPRLLVCR